MTHLRAFLLIVAVVAAGLLPPAFLRAQAPGAVDVFVQVAGVEYQCFMVTHAPTEAVHETPTEPGVTFEPPATFTPAVYATPTPTPTADATPTQEITALPTLYSTPIPVATPETTPVSACTGTVKVGSSLNVRAAPDVYSGAIIGTLYNGAQIDLHATASTNGMLWYRIWWASSGEWGYVAAAFVFPNSAACWGLTGD